MNAPQPRESSGFSRGQEVKTSDPSPRRGLRHSVRKLVYGTFYRLPIQWRRRLVRQLKPRYTVGAVILVRAPGPDGTDRLLLLRQPPGRAWSLPAGLMNRGERPIQCAVRELAEETGIVLAEDQVVPANPNALVYRRWVDCVFLGRVPLETPLTVDGAEVWEAAFHPVDALPPLTPQTGRLLGHYGLGPYAPHPETRES